MARGEHDVGRDERAAAERMVADVDRDDGRIAAAIADTVDDLDLVGLYVVRRLAVVRGARDQ